MYQRLLITAMHTTKCTVIPNATPQDHGEGSPLPYRLLIILSPSRRSLSQKSRRNQDKNTHSSRIPDKLQPLTPHAARIFDSLIINFEANLFNSYIVFVVIEKIIISM